jgi:AcrR family transcriptional regulator
MARTLDLAKRTAILDAAKSIFIRDGYDTAKMSDVAQEAGVAQGTLYLYFDSKESLASAIGEELFSRLISEYASIIKKIEGPDDVETLVEWSLKVAAEDHTILAMIKEHKQRTGSKVTGLVRFVNEVSEALSVITSKGTIRRYENIAVLAELVLSLTRRLLMSRAIFEDTQTDELKAGTITLLQHALFDDVTLAANRLVKRKSERNV